MNVFELCRSEWRSRLILFKFVARCHYDLWNQFGVSRISDQVVYTGFESVRLSLFADGILTRDGIDGLVCDLKSKFLGRFILFMIELSYRFDNAKAVRNSGAKITDKERNFPLTSLIVEHPLDSLEGSARCRELPHDDLETQLLLNLFQTLL